MVETSCAEQGLVVGWAAGSIVVVRNRAHGLNFWRTECVAVAEDIQVTVHSKCTVAVGSGREAKGAAGSVWCIL